MPERESLSINKAPRNFLLLAFSYRHRKCGGRLEASSHVTSSGVYPTHRTRHRFSPSSPYWASTMRSIANSSRERVCLPTSGSQRTFLRTARVGRWPSRPGVSLLGAVPDSLSGYGRKSAGGSWILSLGAFRCCSSDNSASGLLVEQQVVHIPLGATFTVQGVPFRGDRTSRWGGDGHRHGED
jgi:hypothetical protein